MKKQEPVYIIEVNQRIMLKKNNFRVEIFDGYARVTYEKPVVASETYKMMIKNNQPAELEGSTIIEKFKKQSAKEIFEIYKKDLTKAIEKKMRLMKVSYKILKGGEEDG